MGLISGLKGCGYKEPTWTQLRVEFGGAVNESGLFTDAAVASEFGRVQGLEVREHAPFVVVGVLTTPIESFTSIAER
jgi:hypothetical protein